MRKWLPVQMCLCLAMVSALAIVAILLPELFRDVHAIFVIAIAAQLIFCVTMCIRELDWNLWSALNTDVLPWLPTKPRAETSTSKRKTTIPPTCEELQSDEVGLLLMQLDLGDNYDAHWALQRLNDRFGQPIMPVQCWPIPVSTKLQEVAAEVLLREWIEVVKELPGADEDEIIERMFPPIEDNERCKQKPRRFRKLREMTRPATPPPLIVRKLDEWSESVKNAVMDINIGEPTAESFPEEEDQALLPLDRQQFIDTMTNRFRESLDFVADTVAEARTDYELLCNQKKVEPFLANLSWEA
ncbi:MAG TPA: hypothetical protein VGZ47_15620, partial [Gemmataceae bacterium]|nr:hypothetical protein [Gemmataceae bacterium]